MINIKDELHNDFMEYAEEVNNNRAFPDARDGLKPSQRACLWEMFEKGYSSDKPHVKCAKVDGGVTGNWHPHGSEYSTIVRMSQPWINNISEVDFHGANGSLLGGPDAAASRYTECRMSKQTEDGMLCNIKKDVVDFIPNYSEDKEWPKVLPALMPRLFLNGSQGIGYTISQEWEPGNLNEFTEKVKQFISRGKVTYNDIYPDYPTGGIIINKKDIHTIYETGSGKVVLRGKAEVDGDTIKITGLPYQVYAEELIQTIKDLVNDGKLDGIDDICNKSGESGMLIEVQCSSDTNKVLNKLYKLTNLQCSYSVNQMALVNGEPVVLNLENYISVYLNHNLECIKREYKYDLDKAEARLEVVNGLVKALESIDNVILSIKQSTTVESSKLALSEQFGFTSAQADAIVNMRLSKLANLEQKALIDESKQLNTKISECKEVLNNENKVKEVFLNRLYDFTKKYGWKRRTEVTDIEVIKETKTKSDKPKSEFIFALTTGNHIKKVPVVSYKPQTKVISEADRVIKTVKADSKSNIVFITELGMMYKVKASKIQQCTINSTGTDLSTLFDGKAISVFSGSETFDSMVFVSNLGKVKKTITEDVIKLSKKAGAVVYKTDNNERLIYADEAKDLKFVIDGKLKALNTDKLTPHGRKAGGNKYFKVKNTIEGV